MAVPTTVVDCATRKVIDWAMDDNDKTPLITAAIEMAAQPAFAFQDSRPVPGRGFVRQPDLCM
jgi:transposase InsO family protein